VYKLKVSTPCSSITDHFHGMIIPKPIVFPKSPQSAFGAQPGASKKNEFGHAFSIPPSIIDLEALEA
jgi:hypothetical protein